MYNKHTEQSLIKQSLIHHSKRISHKTLHLWKQYFSKYTFAYNNCNANNEYDHLTSCKYALDVLFKKNCFDTLQYEKFVVKLMENMEVQKKSVYPAKEHWVMWLDSKHINLILSCTNKRQLCVRNHII